MVTMRQIAAQAGVSVSTVSRIINSPDNSFARAETRDRVWETIRRTGYVPNKSAKQLRSGKRVEAHSFTISCIFGHTKNPNENPFFSQIANSIEYQALQMGCAVTTSFSVFDMDDMDQLSKIPFVRTDGAIVLGYFNSKKRELIERIYKNIVYIGLNSINAEWDQVICDGYAAARTALKHLISQGHRRIAYIGATEKEVRYKAYTDCLTEHGLPLSTQMIVRTQLNARGGYQGADEYLKRGRNMATALFVGNDITAVATLRRLIEEGVSVPKEISIISIDNIDVAQYMSPMLTTVDVPKEEMGQIATRLLVDRIEKKHRLPMKILLPHRLLVRDSVAKAARV